jgi:surfactin synthase thioesterase subunit
MTSLQENELAPFTPYLWRARRPAAEHRLICFPHAGGGATAYADWAALLPPHIELVAVQLPGRQDRIAEEPFTDVPAMVSVLVHALRPVLDGSFAFFGHSAGAALAFEVAGALRARGSRLPTQLFLSAQPAPGVSAVRRLHELPDQAFRDEILALGGIEAEVADDEDVMDSLLETLRADFTLWERHRPPPAAPIETPITVLAGDTDPRAPLDEVKRWQEYTTAGFAAEFFPGGHFYFFADPAPVLAVIGRTLLPAGGRG